MSLRAPALYLAGSPLQVLCATEARHHWGVEADDATLVVLANDAPAARRQTDEVVELTGWTDIATIPPPAAGTRTRSRAARAIAAEVNEHDTVAIGDHTNRLMRHVAGRGRDVILFDDGVGTRRVAAHRSGRATIGVVFSGRHQRLRDLGAVLSGLRPSVPTQLTFFSFYDLAVGPADSAVRHDFPWLRGRFPAPPVDGTVFIGNSLVEDDLYDEDRYLATASAVMTDLPPPLTYLPHRREDDDKLDRLCRATGARIESPDLPLEISLLRRSHLPAHVVGFYSTAFHSLSVILPPSVSLTTVELDPTGYRRDCEASAREVYDTMAEVTGGRVRLRPAPTSRGRHVVA